MGKPIKTWTLDEFVASLDRNSKRPLESRRRVPQQIQPIPGDKLYGVNVTHAPHEIIPIEIDGTAETSQAQEIKAKVPKRISPPTSSPVSAGTSSSNHSNPATTPTPRLLYCFMFDRTRQVISMASGYESTVETRQRLSYPHCYLRAYSFQDAITTASRINSNCRDAMSPDDSEFETQELFTAIVKQYGGTVNDDPIDPDALPPQKNITAIRRRKSKRSPGKHQQLNAIIADEESKASKRTKFTTTELDRCKREHQPIKYVAPVNPLGCDSIDKWHPGIRMVTLALELARLAQSTLGLPPIDSEELIPPDTTTDEEIAKQEAYKQYMKEQHMYKMMLEREAGFDL